MHALRLTQHSIGTDRYRVEIALKGGDFEKTAQSEFSFSLSPQEQESIRWYLEDYPLYRFDPAPTIAERTEKQMAEMGRNLFRQVFQSDFSILQKCPQNLEESLGLSEKIGDQITSAGCAFNLGRAYGEISDIRNLEKAELWFKRSFALLDERDNFGRSKCMTEMGYVAFERFKEARDANNALKYYHTALEMIPSSAVDDPAVTHNALDAIYGSVGVIEQAVSHYNQSVRYEEMQGNYYGAGITRHNIAIALGQSGRISDALDYARAALRNFETYGNRAAADIEKTKGLTARLSEHDLKD